MTSVEPVIFGVEEPCEYVILGAPRDGGGGERLSFTSRQYHQIVETAAGWREADTVTDDSGATVFRAAGVLVDGTLVGHTVSHGRTQREASVRVERDGRWSSVVESGPVRTEAHGRLRAPDTPIKLRRSRTRENAEQWHVDAVTEFDVTTDVGIIPRRTVGKIKFPGGGTGSFQTDYLGMSSDGRVDSSGAWQRAPGLGPGQTGTQTLKKLPGGSGTDWERHVVDLRTGQIEHDRRIDRQGKEDDGNFHVRNTESRAVTRGGLTTVDTTSEHIWNDDRGSHWQKETSSSTGSTSVERGEFVVDGTSASVSTSTTNADRSTTIVTTTWDTGTHEGQEHTTITNARGEVVSDKTVQGTADEMRAQHRPGDAGQWFDPSPDSSGSEEKKDDDKDEDEDKDEDKGGTDDTNGEEQPDTGDDETETSDDGSGNDDSGGYPGLGWDGGANGPLDLLPAATRAALGRFNDPNHPLDTVGDDSGLVDLLAAALAEAVRRGGATGDGLGDDTGADPLHGVTPEALAKAARDAPPVDPEWGDWSNPKAHAVFVDRVGMNVAVEIAKSPGLNKLTTVDIASALQKFA